MTEISGETEDIRIQRSRALIQQALFELVVEKGYAAVTVRDIAKRAKVNRSTFYRHYLDKYDLLNQYVDQLQAQVAGAALQAERVSDMSPESVPAGLLILVKQVQEHAAFYRVMLGKHGDQAFTHRFRQLSEQRYQRLFSRFDERTNPKSPPIDMKLHYISAAFVGAIEWWLEHNQPLSVEQFTVWLGHLSMMTAGITMQQLKQPSV